MKSEYQCRFCNKIFTAYKGQTGVSCPNCDHSMDFTSSYRLDMLPDQNRDLPVIDKDKVNGFRH